MEYVKVNIISKLGGKRMRERSTSVGKKGVKRTLVKNIFFDPAQPSKKPIFPDFLTNDYMFSQINSVIQEDLVPAFPLLGFGEQQEVFCLSEGIRSHEDDASRRVMLPIPP